MGQRLAYFLVNEAFIRQAFAMPDDCQIVNIYKNEVLSGAGIFAFVVESPEFEPLPEGRALPMVTPVLKWLDDSKRPGNYIRFQWGDFDHGKQDTVSEKD